MAVEYYTPGVYIEEVSSGSKPMTAAPTNVVGFLGETRKGTLNKPILVTSWDQYFDNFIGYTLTEKMTPRGVPEKDINGNVVMVDAPFDKVTDLDWGVYVFFANGGAKCHVVSVNIIADDSGKQDALKKEIDIQTALLAKTKDKEKTSIETKIEELKTQLANGVARPNITKELIGNDGGPNKRTGIKCFKDVSEVAILVAPGVTTPAVQQEILSYVEAANIFTILDAPQTLEGLSANNLSADLNGLSGLSAKSASKQAALYFPWVNTYDPSIDADIQVAPSGFVAGVYARTDNDRGVHKAPANETVRLATSLAYTLSDTEQESLNMNGINVIRDFADKGIVVWGARTTVSMIDPEWRYVNVRRLFNMIEKSLEMGTQWAVFEPNDAKLWIALKRNTVAFLSRLYKSGAFAGANRDEAFFVKCDASTNPQESVDAGIVTIEIGIAPVKPAEFIVFKIAQKSPQDAEEAKS
ncbi:MAG: phage tail sheath family protein [Epsilonproteobacteria bacterium]|nr:MAG: phage tail sheath family protein [Campylobacterota bacterium]